MPGRPPKPTSIHVVQGTARKARIEARMGELALTGVMPSPPAFLSREALVEWGRVTSLSAYVRALTQADYASLALYCQLFGEFELSCALGAEPMQTSRMALFMNIAGKLGMNPSDRVKVHVPSEEKPANKFARLSNE